MSENTGSSDTEKSTNHGGIQGINNIDNLTINNTRIRVPSRYPESLLAIGEEGFYGWQEYWHNPRVAPASQWTTQQTLSNMNLDNISCSKIDSTSAMENEISRIMQEYRDTMEKELHRFPNADQQRTVFRLMIRASNGSIDRDYNTHRTLLHYMAMNGVSDILGVLVDVGFDVNSRDSNYMTPLHLAVLNNHAETVETLINECHADVHMKDLNNKLPWHFAIGIDIWNVHEDDTQVRSKERILRVLAAHTDLEKVRNIGSRKILKQLKGNINAEIEFS